MNSEIKREEQKAVTSLRKSKGESVIVGESRDFLHFLLDYDIVTFTVSFIVGKATYDVISSGVLNGLSTVFQLIGYRMKDFGEFWRLLIIFLVVLLICFIFIQYIFQPIIASKAVAEERRLKEIVKTSEEKKIEEQVHNVKQFM
jgi:large-conductance mechanosensitive channel